MSLDLEDMQPVIKQNLRQLKECMCPVFKSPCLKEQCWVFKRMEEVAWPEEVMKKNSKTGRIQPHYTSKIIIGTLLSCGQNVFPQMIESARYSSEKDDAHWNDETETIVNSEGEAWEAAKEYELHSMKEKEKQGSLLKEEKTGKEE